MLLTRINAKILNNENKNILKKERKEDGKREIHYETDGESHELRQFSCYCHYWNPSNFQGWEYDSRAATPSESRYKAYSPKKKSHFSFLQFFFS